MDRLRRRTGYYTLALFGSILLYAVLYQNGMRVYEGERLSFLHSFRIVVEAYTTTGFGSDAPWQTATMNVLVTVMNLTGVFLIFLALPVLAFPLLEDVLSTTVPRSVDDDLDDHVVVCSHSSRAEALIEELSSFGIDYLIIEPEAERATELYGDGYSVIHGDPTSVAGLERAQLRSARALVADVSDQVDASIVLTAQEIADDVPVVSVLEDPPKAQYHRLAGADDVLSPRPILGESLASKVTTFVTGAEGDTVEIGDDLEIAELPVRRGSRLAGSTLAESGIGDRAGVNVIGAWRRGEFESPPDPKATLTTGTVLLVTGSEAQLQQLQRLSHADVRQFDHGQTIVVGLGTVGQAVTDTLEEAGLPYTVVDRTEMDGVDVVGDATDPETLRAAGIDDARSVILALPDDTTTEFLTLVIRDVSPQTELIARVEETPTMQKLYRAGADYVLSLASVSGRMTASTILDDRDVLSLDQQVEVVRTAAPELVGQTIGDARVRTNSGCTVVGVERDGAVLADAGPTVRIQSDDKLVIAGTGGDIQRFNELYT
ncbi:MAG: K+ transport system, NAD-binding component [uncultured archaeon A07HB70]|nr:MAG: K+ transport system, NAD-binding component [uncultured archaeon A07HB70]